MPDENNLSEITTEVVTTTEETKEVLPVVEEVKTPNDDFVDLTPKVEVTNYNRSGDPSTDENDTIVAKKIVTKDGESYKLAFFGSALYNPTGAFSTREKAIRGNFKFINVKKEDFDSFIEFLGTNNLNTYYTINRKVLNNV